MVEIELDGRKVEVPEGSMVMHAAELVGAQIPHFCYHKKLSIAANCRMCLVDVEKAPKPLPACATPVTQGMVVRTRSEKALKAQQGVMEFLLINHPLDCPICDQGGECQLQDLAVGYGKSASRYQEEKRVVFHKNVGPLISMEEMSRCIHCTRCVRFGQEIAGVMEFGMAHRGEHAEITTFLGQSVDSELSGNMIDLCPVGALTSKPFRYSARTWELSRRRTVAPHDSVGTNLIAQIKDHKVMRIVPFENDDVNGCWISDRDRFSYEALNANDRLTAPQVKRDGQWATVDWNTALEFVASGLQKIKSQHGAAAIGGLGSSHSTVEELFLLAQLIRGLGSDNVDYRLRHADFEKTEGARWLGMPIRSLDRLDTALVLGSFLRKDHPLFAARLRHATKHGARVMAITAAGDDWLMPLEVRQTVAPLAWGQALAAVACAVAREKGIEAPTRVPSNDAANDMALALLNGENKAILLGNTAAQHPQASLLLALAQWIGEQTGATVGYLGDAVNAVGAQLVGAMPQGEGLNARQMLSDSLRAYVLLNVEPELDSAIPTQAKAALMGSEMVVALSAFRSQEMLEYANVLLPLAPFTETSGTFVNAEGREQSFVGVVRPAGQARPGWKILRVLGNLLGLSHFDFETSAAVRDAALGHQSIPTRLSNKTSRAIPEVLAETNHAGLERVADIPIYATDTLVRRAPSLQLTVDARRAAQVYISPIVWNQLGLKPGEQVRVSSGQGSAVLKAAVDPGQAASVVRIASGLAETSALDGLFGAVALERV